MIAATGPCYLDAMLLDPLPAESIPPRLLTTLLPIPLAALLAALVLLFG